MVSLNQNDIELKPDNGRSYYSLWTTFLMHTYEVMLGITQIISTIDQLMAWSSRRSFSIDKGFMILKQLAIGDDADHIQLSFYTLQAWCKGAVNHIRQPLNSMKTTFGQFHNTLTNHSYNSTLSNIHSNYGLLAPRMEVARHIMREDYQVGLPEHLWAYKDKLVEEWVRLGWMINNHLIKGSRRITHSCKRSDQIHLKLGVIPKACYWRLVATTFMIYTRQVPADLSDCNHTLLWKIFHSFTWCLSFS